MQIHLVRLQTFSQEVLAAKETEMPSFEEAFDTEFLKKFFQNHDSVANTPFTSYTDTPPTYDEIQSLSGDSQDIFGNKIQNRIKSYSEENFPINFSFNPEIEREVSGINNFFKNDTFKNEKLEFNSHTTYQMMSNFTNQKIAEEQKKSLFNVNGQITINFAKKGLLNEQSKNHPIKIASSQPTMGDILEDNFKIDDNLSLYRNRSKKAVFTIERNVRTNAIAKIEKKKIVNPIIKKKKEEKEAQKKEKKAKESETSEKKTEKIEEIVDSENKKKKPQSGLSATKSSKKEKASKTN